MDRNVSDVSCVRFKSTTSLNFSMPEKCDYRGDFVTDKNGKDNYECLARLDHAKGCIYFSELQGACCVPHVQPPPGTMRRGVLDNYEQRLRKLSNGKFRPNL